MTRFWDMLSSFNPALGWIWSYGELTFPRWRGFSSGGGRCHGSYIHRLLQHTQMTNLVLCADCTLNRCRSVQTLSYHKVYAQNGKGQHCHSHVDIMLYYVYQSIDQNVLSRSQSSKTNAGNASILWIIVHPVRRTPRDGVLLSVLCVRIHDDCSETQQISTNSISVKVRTLRTQRHRTTESISRDATSILPRQ